MEGRERRERIIDILKNSDEPLSGTALAAGLKVSRQVLCRISHCCAPSIRI